eukprot:CAMPEP_0170647444 /NCGR_PEP_ID=MMETSP0224-20130122/44189_1 /TAXON_ID=285029 /ORGANISM="Togula jolla, Strain CCCM 725" /LENGTH=67 /DNA_ID=CAMNT_0010978873 /DNA_START=59 /DNA_END=258 /DNA_ORIENTATION=-
MHGHYNSSCKRITDVAGKEYMDTIALAKSTQLAPLIVVEAIGHPALLPPMLHSPAPRRGPPQDPESA